MNILKVIFGKSLSGKSTSTPIPPPAVPPQSAKVVSAYIAGQINQANTSESASELATLARDYSGYIRQAAISRCAVLAKPELLPVIVGRLNDWVPAVRQTARAAVMTVMPLVPPSLLLEALPAIQHLHAAGRADHAQWIESFEQKLVQLIDFEEIVLAAKGSNIKVARACFHILKKFHLMDAAELLHMILVAGNDIVLSLEGVQLVAELPVEVQRSEYRLALRSHFGAVRTIALRTLLASHDDANTELATTALLDLQSSVRDIAAAFLRTAGFDLREFYRGVLQRQFRPQVKLIQVALTSLAALRSEEDIVLVKEHVAHERISVRKTALASWLKLSPQDKDEIAARALADQGAPVRKFALQIVRKHGAYIPFSSVRRRLSEIGDLSLLLQFAQSRVWDGLECIVQEGMRDMTEAGRKALLVEALRDWIARAGHRYEVASASQREWLCSPTAMKVLHDLLDNNKYLIERLNLELST